MPLRPINETRRADGSFTSETAFRLNQRKAGLASAKYWRARDFANLRLGSEMAAFKRQLQRLQRSGIEGLMWKGKPLAPGGGPKSES